MKVMIDGYLSDNGIGVSTFRVELSLVSARLLSSWMVEKSTLGRVCL